jgi:hypothetical protein
MAILLQKIPLFVLCSVSGEKPQTEELFVVSELSGLYLWLR